MRPFVHLSTLVSVFAGCAAPSGESTDTSANDLTYGGVDMGEHWRPAFQCDGAHVDVFDKPGYEYLQQVVVTDGSAAGYLRGKLDNAIATDPYSLHMSKTDRLRPGGPNEMIFFYVGSYPLRNFLLSASVTGGQEIRVDTQELTWDQDLGGGTFRRNTDMKVRIVRNGWHEYHCDPGLSGDPPTCGFTGRGWDEWEIANWVFRNCH
jgi:hypothetical protein